MIQLPIFLTLLRISSSFKVLTCNRGFCYTKNFEQNSAHHLYTGKNKPRSSALNFCTDKDGSVTDCELIDILGLGAEDYEAVFDANAVEDRYKTYSASFEGKSDTTTDNTELHGGHIPWREKPKKGMCYDSKLSYAFDCNLIDVLDEGLLLIEDLRAGGVFVAQPKSGFTTRNRSVKPHLEPLETPDVMVGSLSTPTEDFRTNVQMNLEGI